MVKNLIGLYKENIFYEQWHLILDREKEHDIRSQILKTIFGLHASVFLDPNMYDFQNICRFLWSQTPEVDW